MPLMLTEPIFADILVNKNMESITKLIKELIKEILKKYLTLFLSGIII